MSLSLFGVPDGHKNNGQSKSPCPSVYSPAAALGSLSSVALSSEQASIRLTQRKTKLSIQAQIFIYISSGFLREAMNRSSSGFLREATGAQERGRLE